MASVSAGTVVGGKYRLEEPVGRGGMASVWRATHTLLESSVAVKFLETFGTSREKMAKRFFREAKLAGNLKHRNVVHILDYGVMDDGQPFMVMELLEGTSLADRFDHGPPVSEVELFEIVAKVLSGLAAVHDAGIVHRDIKPDNIFLVRDADGDYPKLLDFGISRGVELEDGDTRVTNTGAVMGTPLYMSPEQARGLKDVDPRTDLWSVGVILWEGLSGGALPFEAEHMGDVLIRIATEDAPSIASIRPDLPEEVVAVIARALQRDRDARFQNAREMREAVRKAAEALAAAALEPGRPRALAPASQKSVSTREIRAEPREPKKRPWGLVAGGAAVAALAAGAVAFVALGGEIRFSAAAAEPLQPAPQRTAASPPPEPSREAPPPTPDPADAPAAPAEPVPAAPAPPAEAPPPSAQAPAAAPATERATESAAPRRARAPRRPRRAPTRSSAESPSATAPRTPRPEEGAQESGGFLRNLDY